MGESRMAWNTRRRWITALLAVITLLFFILLLRTLHHAEDRVESKGVQFERDGPG